MEFKEVGGHTFCPELLSDGCILDIGCRGFDFAKHFRGKTVYNIDPDSTVFNNVIMDDTFFYLNVAISNYSGESAYYENGEATCLKEIDPDQSHPFKPCTTITMDDLYKITGENVDILKLDCEGAEYIILGETFKPIPKQLSVEFHKHCVPDMHNKHIDSIIERLSKDYMIYGLEEERRHGCTENFWDVLFIRKDLI